MTTLERVKSQGQRLFAARSVVPLAVLPLVALAMPDAWRVQSSRSSAAATTWLGASIALGLVGLAIRAAAVAYAPEGTSSRDTHQLRAPSLNTSGMYSVVRNPLYVGNALLWLGAVASLGLWWLVALTAALYWLYIERVILVEETFLEQEFGSAFTAWAADTPAFIPRVARWRPPATQFSWRRLSAEHNGLLGFLATVTAFSIGVEMIAGQRPWQDWRADHQTLIASLGIALLLSLLLVAAKKLER